jgi:hypothetical protein
MNTSEDLRLRGHASDAHIRSLAADNVYRELCAVDFESVMPLGDCRDARPGEFENRRQSSRHLEA